MHEDERQIRLPSDRGATISTYDRIGSTYARTRRPDPRIRDAVWSALGPARSVVNVGAGTGSYEPPQTVVAIEPSRVMVAQRPAGLAPAVLADAAHLPLPDRAVDAGLCVLTVHHWPDLEAGLAELRRVARRAVILTWDQDVFRHFWLVSQYFPAIVRADDRRAVPIAKLCELLRTAAVTPVPIPHDCEDGFLGAYWRRPESYLDPIVRAGMSAFSIIDDGSLTEGVESLRRDLTAGAWHASQANLLELQQFDLGYRLIVADWTR